MVSSFINGGIILVAPVCAITSENDSTEVFLTALNTATKLVLRDAKVQNDKAIQSL